MQPHRGEESQALRDRTAALALISDSAVMTLAVTTTDGPWAAPVYFVYLATDTGFYFFSSPESRHVRAALKEGTCGGAIFRPANLLEETDSIETNAWENICGLQMRGELTKAGVFNGTKALSLYLNKFPFSRSLLPQGKDQLSVFQQHLGVRFYRFCAAHVEWTDNRIHFGYRTAIVL